MTTTRTIRTVGDMLRLWRQRRGMSQLDLACEADVSQRHVSFLETGRSQPSRSMLLHLAERLDVPPRERNSLLVAAGFAPVHPERSLDDPALAAARRVVESVLAGHEPFPALAVDRLWRLVAANRVVPLLLEGAAPELLTPPVNMLRLSLHPRGLASRIENLGQWRDHVLHRLQRQVEASGDPAIRALRDELRTYPVREAEADVPHPGEVVAEVAIPLRLRVGPDLLVFLGTTTIFGTATDVTLSELVVEAFFPADEATAERLRRLARRVEEGARR